MAFEELAMAEISSREIPEPKIVRKAALVLILVLLGVIAYAIQPRDWKVETFESRGYVLINGKIPVNASIRFCASGDPVDSRESRPWGLIDEFGAYSLTTYELYDGAPQGKYAVTIRWPADLTKPSPDRLLGKFSDDKDPPLVVEVKPRKNYLPALILEDAAVDTAGLPDHVFKDED